MLCDACVDSIPINKTGLNKYILYKFYHHAGDFTLALPTISLGNPKMCLCEKKKLKMFLIIYFINV